jgi:alpha-2-macroglobulin
MKYKYYGMVAMTALLFVCSCRSKNGVSLSFTNAKNEVPVTGNLVFRFSKTLIASGADSLLNNWIDEDLVSFEPAIAGRFRWQQPDELVFSPAKPLHPATTYKASFNRTLFKYSKYDKIDTKKPVTFSTPNVGTEDVSLFWQMQDAAKRTIVPQLDLYFNYPVNPAQLKEYLEVMVDDKKTDFSLAAVTSDKKISVRLLNVATTDKDYTARITIKKGLKPEGGKNGIPEDDQSTLNIPSPYRLNVQNIAAEHDGTAGTVKIATSQKPVAEELAQYINISPAVKFTTEATEDGFYLRSENFDVTKTYELTMKQGLRGVIGGNLKEEYKNNIVFGQLEPSIRFASEKGMYLSRNGLQNMEVKINNVEKFKVVISKIYESNLLSAENSGYSPRETSGNENAEENESENSEEYGDDEYGYGSSSIGDVIYEKVVETKTLPRMGASRLFKFNITDRLPDFKGIYHIMIRSANDYWLKDSRFISLSDIGLIAKEGREKIVVFANSIKTADALSGVNVVAYGNNNQVLAMGATGNDGVAELTYTRKEFAGFKPAMIIAKTDEDFNYLPFKSTSVNTSRFDVGGKRIRSSGLDAFIYAERDIYRPGEKINYSVILRDKDWKSPGDIPVKLRMLMPNGKELKNFRKALNEQGSLEGSMDISRSALTGTYSLEVYSANDVLLGTQSFVVEEFVPDRIKVTTKLNKPSYTPGDSVALAVNAVNYFGPPAANRNYECEIQLKTKSFTAEKYPRYDFSLASQNTFFDKILRQGTTDANGNVQQGYTVPATYANIGLLEAGFFATVFDENARPVSRHIYADIHTQPVFFGVKDDGYSYFSLNTAANFPLIALNRDKKPVNATAKIQVIKHEYRTVLAKTGSYFRYESQKSTKVLEEKNVSINGENTVYNFTPKASGEYELRISVPGANAYVSRNFYSYGNWGNDNQSFEVNNEGHIDIETDKEKYQTGETVKALFKAPFNGRMLVTFETDHVIKHQYVEVKDRTASLSFKTGSEHLPGFYISATLIKPHQLSDIPLTVAHGYQPVKADDANRKINVQITAAKTARSKTKQKITVKGAPNSMITLAAVDNGVLAMNGYDSPDPYAYFYKKRALDVKGYDLYPLLLPEIRQRLSSTGGDGDLEMDKRVNPVQGNRFKVMSFWSGIRKANGSGNAEFEVDIPQFSGEVRLMAVAYKDEKFGSAHQEMTIADPIVLSTALPRFFSPGDTVTVPVTITNTTAKAATATASIKVTGPMQAFGSTQTVNLAANGEGRVLFKIGAANGIGAGKVNIEISSMGEKFNEETEITVRPPSTLQKQTGSGSISGGSTQTITLNTSDFMAGTSNYQLVVSKSPALEIADQMSYLVQYPYGCTEQTISSAFPQIYYGDMADAMGLTRDNANAAANVMEAIRKIKMRQLYNGAVTLWDGGGTEDWWTTIYALHFLTEAGKAGYEADNSLKETISGYLISRLRNRELIPYYYNRIENKKIAPKEVAYSLYVLALANKKQVATMNYYKSQPAILALDSRYLLSAAYALSGDRAGSREILPTTFAGEESVTQTGGSYYSPVRDEAIALNAILDIDANNQQIPTMAKHVTDNLKQRTYLSTQERSFGFLALGKMLRSIGNTNISAEVKANGKTIASTDGKTLKLDAKQLGSGNIQIVTKGTGKLFYYWQTEGISSTGSYKEEDSYLKVRRNFYNRNGQLVNGNTFKQNDLIIVRVIIEKTFGNMVNNVVITDLLPAGFEIENPRVKELPGMDWIKDASTPTALDIRDDRINFFTDVSGTQHFYYAVRAVSTGMFRMGPVSADAMYAGEYHSYHGAGVIRVLPQ